MSNHPTSGRCKRCGAELPRVVEDRDVVLWGYHVDKQEEVQDRRELARENGRKANRGWLTTERAKVLGKIGADKFAASRRGKSILPRCVGCLLAIGWGIKRIVRHTGWAKTSVHRWAKFNGLNLRATAEQKKQAAMGQRKRKAAEKKAARLAERARKKAERAANRQTDKERNAKALAYYYANHERNKKRAAAYMRKRYADSDNGSPFRISLRLRARVCNAIKQGGGRKPGRTFDITGCTVHQLKAWLESQFCARMSWDNYGRAWHIDHIMPCASFDLTKPDQVRQCFHYTNLRPLWAKANRKKWATVTDPQFSLLLPAS